MLWRGIEGDWPAGITWNGPVDDTARPHGHGYLSHPAGVKSRIEFEEGAMLAGRRQGLWVVKRRAPRCFP